jgi:hypothetical protein
MVTYLVLKEKNQSPVSQFLNHSVPSFFPNLSPISNAETKGLLAGHSALGLSMDQFAMFTEALSHLFSPSVYCHLQCNDHW